MRYLALALLFSAPAVLAAEPAVTPTFSTVQPNPALAQSLSSDTFGSNPTFRNSVQPAGGSDFTGTTDLNTGSFSLSTGGVASGVPDAGVGPDVIGSVSSGVPSGF